MRKLGTKVVVMLCLPVALGLCSMIAWAQQSSGWQDEVRQCAEMQDWSCALALVEREVARAPRDMDIRAWRARVLLCAGKLTEAEAEYEGILTAVSNDPDYWVGLSQVFSREGRLHDALHALDRAVALDPNRADLRVARAVAMRGLDARHEATLELHRALQLDPTNADGRVVLRSVRDEFRHELRVGVNTDWFNFADANQEDGLMLISRWTSRWMTSVAASNYHWGDTDAKKFVASVTGKLPAWGGLTVGGAAAHDHGIVPRHEAFFDYDRGFKLRGKFVRGWEIVYGQHLFWYSTARILTLRESTLFYLPRDWTWSLSLTGAQSQFSGAGTEWRPSGMTRLGFPIGSREQHRVDGNVFFAVGTENFARADQIGESSSQTYGCGLRFQFAKRQSLTGFAAYQKRTEARTESSFGFTYGVRF